MPQTREVVAAAAGVAIAAVAGAWYWKSTAVDRKKAEQKALSKDGMSWGLLDKFCAEKTVPLAPRPKICDTALDAIGNTPLVRLQKVPGAEGVECEVLAKCEFFNAGGSVKDRIGKRMVLDAQERGDIKPGDYLIEPTSGNTGIGLALAGAILGYKVVICLPEKMSDEKVNVLKALGAVIHRTPTEAASSDPSSHISVAKRLKDMYNKEHEKDNTLPRAHILDQYGNPSNPLAHFDGTAEEIIAQCDGKIDLCVMGAGTGGTMTGLARKLKAKIPGIKIVAVDPLGSLLAKGADGGEEISGYQVEGIGYDFVPDVCDRSIVDDWVKSEDHESFRLARALIHDEGLLCGGSCGSALAGALKACRGETMNKTFKGLKKGQRCVVILPDSTRNYMTKFLSDDWMRRNSFLPPIRAKKHASTTVGNMIEALSIKKPTTVKSKDSIQTALNIMGEKGFDRLPVIAPVDPTTAGCRGQAIGFVSHKQIEQRLRQRGQLTTDSSIDTVCVLFNKMGGGKKKTIKPITKSTMFSELEGFFDNNFCAFVAESETDDKIAAVITKHDLLNYNIAAERDTPRAADKK